MRAQKLGRVFWRDVTLASTELNGHMVYPIDVQNSEVAITAN